MVGTDCAARVARPTENTPAAAATATTPPRSPAESGTALVLTTFHRPAWLGVVRPDGARGASVGMVRPTLWNVNGSHHAARLGGPCGRGRLVLHLGEVGLPARPSRDVAPAKEGFSIVLSEPGTRPVPRWVEGRTVPGRGVRSKRKAATAARASTRNIASPVLVHLTIEKVLIVDISVDRATTAKALLPLPEVVRQITGRPVVAGLRPTVAVVRSDHRPRHNDVLASVQVAGAEVGATHSDVCGNTPG